MPFRSSRQLQTCSSFSPHLPFTSLFHTRDRLRSVLSRWPRPILFETTPYFLCAVPGFRVASFSPLFAPMLFHSSSIGCFPTEAFCLMGGGRFGRISRVLARELPDEDTPGTFGVLPCYVVAQ